MSQLRLRLFGPFDLSLDQAALPKFDYTKLPALLAYLALEAGRPHPRAALAGLLWSERSEQAARSSLRQAIARLRHIMGDAQSPTPCLIVSRETVSLDAANGPWLDVAEFDTLWNACRSHRHRSLETCSLCLERLAQAVGLYRGELLEDLFVNGAVLFEEWALIKREVYRTRALEALATLTGAAAYRGDHEQAIHYARRQIALDPWHEEAHRGLMRALAQQGRRSEALAQYDRCRRALADGLGVGPAAETETLYRQIRAAALPATRRPGERGCSLPLPTTPFIGRQQELARIRDLLADTSCRLLTLVGPGGIGKTRLALRAVQQVSGAGDRVCCVPLVAPVMGDQFLSVLAEALSLVSNAGRPLLPQILDFVRGEDLLLVLDNAERLLGAAVGDGSGPQALLTILHHAPGVRVLATSRQRLWLPGEWLLPVEGLPCPPAGAGGQGSEGEAGGGCAALDLFVACAQRLLPGFTLAADDWPHAARICRLLGGAPLGLELAAGWLRVFSCREVADGVEGHLDFLNAYLPHVPADRQGLRAVFDRSWQLLTPTERAALSRLALLPGNFDRQEAERNAGAGALLLSALVEKSVVRREGDGRFAVLELVRQYAAEKLLETPGAQSLLNGR